MEQVSLRDVRSYSRLELELEPGLVLITGRNGAGKTNLLEAVHLATQGLSFRSRQDAQIVRRGADEGLARVSGARDAVAVESEVRISTREANRFLEVVQDLAGLPAGALGALNVALPAGRVTLAPVKGIFDAPVRSAEPAAVRRVGRRVAEKTRTKRIKTARRVKKVVQGKKAPGTRRSRG